jgi:HEAT repeat protein
MAFEFQEHDEMENTRQGEKPSLELTIESLKSVDENVTASTLYYGLSGLTPPDIQRLGVTWETLTDEKRRIVLEELTEASELNFELDYRELGFFALNDANAGVREAAINLLWEDESLELTNRLIDMVQWDEAYGVRAAAVSALGRFLLLGEYDELPTAEVTRIQDIVVNILLDADEEVDVRRRALEAIANGSHEIVPEAIEEAYQSSEDKMRISSLYAMGRTYDRSWRKYVLDELGSSDPEMRYEAVRAAGELELRDAIPSLGRIAAEDDREIREVAIWSLGEIAGREALRILTMLAEDIEADGDENLLEAVEDAIGNANLVGDELDFDDDDE